MARVYVSAVMNGSIEQAWGVLRDFNGLPDYHPFFASSFIEGGKPADQVGCVRNFRSHDGGQIREELLTLSDREHVCCYRILDASALPVRNYVAEMRLLPVTESGQTFGQWWAEYDVDPENAADCHQRVSDTFRLAFDSVSKRFSKVG